MDEFKSSTGAYIGTCPWAYGGIWRPETEHENEFGMVWAGDPPHESPGWYDRASKALMLRLTRCRYDLYDTDEAMNIVARQQKNIADWLGNHTSV